LRFDKPDKTASLGEFEEGNFVEKTHERGETEILAKSDDEIQSPSFVLRSVLLGFDDKHDDKAANEKREIESDSQEEFYF